MTATKRKPPALANPFKGRRTTDTHPAFVVFIDGKVIYEAKSACEVLNYMSAAGLPPETMVLQLWTAQGFHDDVVTSDETEQRARKAFQTYADALMCELLDLLPRFSDLPGLPHSRDEDTV